MKMKIIITFFVIICSIGLTSINNAYAAADTWTAATTTNAGTHNMYGVSMSDASNGVAVGNSGQIVYTTNGGVDWTGSTQDVSELAEILGIADEQLPPWVANLALWVSEDRISMGDMIVSIEHLINN